MAFALQKAGPGPCHMLVLAQTSAMGGRSKLHNVCTPARPETAAAADKSARQRPATGVLGIQQLLRPVPLVKCFVLAHAHQSRKRTPGMIAPQLPRCVEAARALRSGNSPLMGWFVKVVVV